MLLSAHRLVFHRVVVRLAMTRQRAGTIADCAIREGDRGAAIGRDVTRVEVDQVRVLRHAMRIVAGGAGGLRIHHMLLVIQPTGRIVSCWS